MSDSNLRRQKEGLRGSFENDFGSEAADDAEAEAADAEAGAVPLGPEKRQNDLQKREKQRNQQLRRLDQSCFAKCKDRRWILQYVETFKGRLDQ